MHEWLTTLTNREFEVRYHWLSEQWNNPDRSDHYLMQIAAMLSSSKKSKGLGSFKLQFQSSKTQAAEKSPSTDVKLALCKSAWQARLKNPGKRPVKDKS